MGVWKSRTKIIFGIDRGRVDKFQKLIYGCGTAKFHEHIQWWLNVEEMKKLIQMRREETKLIPLRWLLWSIWSGDAAMAPREQDVNIHLRILFLRQWTIADSIDNEWVENSRHI